MRVQAAYNCDTCRDRQFVIIPDGGNGTAKPCHCRRIEPETLLEAMGVPSAYRVVWPAASFDPWPTSHMDYDVSRWTAAKTDPRLILLTGNLQTGKSTRAVELCRRAINAGNCRSVAWLTPTQLEREERTSSLGYSRPLFSKARQAQITVIDNFGVDQMTIIGKTVLRELVDDRYSSDKPLIITTGLPFSSAQKEEYGAPTSIQEYSPELAARMLRGLVLRVRKTF